MYTHSATSHVTDWLTTGHVTVYNWQRTKQSSTNSTYTQQHSWQVSQLNSTPHYDTTTDLNFIQCKCSQSVYEMAWQQRNVNELFGLCRCSVTSVRTMTMLCVTHCYWQWESTKFINHSNWATASQYHLPLLQAALNLQANQTSLVTYSTVTKAPGRAVATEGRCVRAGRNESQRRLSSAVSPVCSTRTNMHFDTMRSIQRSFIHSTTISLLYRVPAVFAPRDSEPARRGAHRLSHVEMSGTKL